MKIIRHELIFGMVFLAHISSAAPRVAVVDIQRVIDGSKAGQSAKAALQAEMQSKQQSLFQLGKEVEQMRSELNKQAALLSKEALEKRQIQLTQKETEAKRQIEDQREDLRKGRDRAIGQLVDEIDAAVKQLAAKELYDIVVERDQELVLFVSDDMDISAKVIKVLDSKK